MNFVRAAQLLDLISLFEGNAAVDARLILHDLLKGVQILELAGELRQLLAGLLICQLLAVLFHLVGEVLLQPFVRVWVLLSGLDGALRQAGGVRGWSLDHLPRMQAEVDARRQVHLAALIRDLVWLLFLILEIIFEVFAGLGRHEI